LNIPATERLTALQRKMAEENVDLAIYGPSPEFEYLTGIVTSWRKTEEWEGGIQHLFVPREGRPCAILYEGVAKFLPANWPGDVKSPRPSQEYPALLSDALNVSGGALRRVALSRILINTPPLMQALWKRGGEIAFSAADGLLDDARRIKTPEEIEKLAASAALCDKVMERIVPQIKEGVTQRDLELEIEFQGRRLGATDVSFPPAALFVKSGTPATDDPFVYPREKGLVPGTSIAFDYGFVLDGYCSDYGRSFYFGTASEEVRKAYPALQKAVLQLIADIQPGKTLMCDFFPMIERTLDGLGFGDYIRARLPGRDCGHHIGLGLHELPILAPPAKLAVQVNNVMMVEPKLWHSGEYYLRVEDMILVEAGGVRPLTTFDRELFLL
jgi:Xaa-Pro aminopeptidase